MDNRDINRDGKTTHTTRPPLPHTSTTPSPTPLAPIPRPLTTTSLLSVLQSLQTLATQAQLRSQDFAPSVLPVAGLATALILTSVLITLLVWLRYLIMVGLVGVGVGGMWRWRWRRDRDRRSDGTGRRGMGMDMDIGMGMGRGSSERAGRDLDELEEGAEDVD